MKSFSLVELLVVMAIIAVILGVVFSAIHSTDGATACVTTAISDKDVLDCVKAGGTFTALPEGDYVDATCTTPAKVAHIQSATFLTPTP